MLFLRFICHQTKHLLLMDCCWCRDAWEASKIGQVIPWSKCSSTSHAAVCIVSITIVIMVANVVIWYYQCSSSAFRLCVPYLFGDYLSFVSTTDEPLAGAFVERHVEDRSLVQARWMYICACSAFLPAMSTPSPLSKLGR